MALSGTFEANFDSFIKATTDSAAGLEAMEKAGKQTETTVNASFAKMTATAQSTTTATAKMGSASSNTFSTMAKELRTVDQSMAAFGVSINPVIHVLGEMGTVVGRTAASLSLLEKASVVLAVAMGAWQVGRWIAGIAGLDEKFADLAATIQGKTTPSFEAWRNNLEVGRRAIAAGFTGDIKDLAGATAYLTKVAADNAEALNTSAVRVQGWNKEIDTAAKSGNLKIIVSDLETQNSTHEPPPPHHQNPIHALNYLQRGLKDAAEATREEARANEEAAKTAQT